MLASTNAGGTIFGKPPHYMVPRYQCERLASLMAVIRNQSISLHPAALHSAASLPDSPKPTGCLSAPASKGTQACALQESLVFGRALRYYFHISS